MSKRLSWNWTDMKKTARDSAFYGCLATAWGIVYPILEPALYQGLQGLSGADLTAYGIYGTMTITLSQLILRFFKKRK